MPDILDVLGILYVLINYLVLLPFIIYSIHRYEQTSRDQSHLVITFRHKKLIYVLNYMILIRLLIERPLQMTYRVWLILDESTLYFAQIFSELIMDGILLLFTIKVYHFYFKHRYSLSIADETWRTDINPTDTNWYILHKHTFGDPSWLMKCCIPSFALFTIVDVVLIFTRGERSLSYRAINAFVEILLLSIAFITYWKIRSFDDAYHIRKEVLFQFIALGMCLIVTLVIHSAFCDVPQIDLNAQADTDHGDHLHNPRLHSLLLTYASECGILPLALSSLWYPLYLVNRSQNELKSSIQYSPRSEVTKFALELDKMLLVIATEEFFKAFMQYLIESLCCENLLFIVELIQIKIAFQTKHNDIIQVPKHTICAPFETDPEKEADTGCVVCHCNSDSTTSGHRYAIVVYHDFDGNLVFDGPNSNEFRNLHVSVPSNVPQTIILAGDNTQSFTHQMNELYLKYIKVGSYHELNLSYEKRKTLGDFFELKMPKVPNDAYEEEMQWQLYSILDDVCISILDLMYEPLQLFLARHVDIRNKVNELLDDKGINDERKVDTLLTVLERVRVYV